MRKKIKDYQYIK